MVDIVICDGGSTDGSMNPDTLELYGVNTLLVKTGPGKQGAQLRMGLHFALTFGYKGVLTLTATIRIPSRMFRNLLPS